MKTFEALLEIQLLNTRPPGSERWLAVLPHLESLCINAVVATGVEKSFSINVIVATGLEIHNRDMKSTMNDFRDTLMEASMLMEGTIRRINATTSLGVRASDSSSSPPRVMM